MPSQGIFPPGISNCYSAIGLKYYSNFIVFEGPQKTGSPAGKTVAMTKWWKENCREKTSFSLDGVMVHLDCPLSQKLIAKKFWETAYWGQGKAGQEHDAMLSLQKELLQFGHQSKEKSWCEEAAWEKYIWEVFSITTDKTHYSGWATQAQDFKSNPSGLLNLKYKVDFSTWTTDILNSK